MTPYPQQIAAVKAAARAHRGIVSAITGSGKSLMIGMLIQELQCRTLVVTPSVELKQQFEATLALWFGADRVGPGRDIYVENVQALGPLPHYRPYDCICIDEFHHSAAKTYRDLNKKAWGGIYYRFGFTSTPFRNDDNETLLLEGILSQVIYKLSYQTAVKAGIICPVEAYCIDVPKQETEAYTWAQVYSQLVVNNEARNEAIAHLALTLNAADTSALILVKEVKHGKILEEMTGLPFVHGQDYDSRVYINLFNAGSAKVIIATEGIMGEGVDTRACEFVVIAGLGKAKSGFMQKVGRCVRRFEGKESGKVILFKDRSHKFLLRHYNAQAKIIAVEYNVIVTKLE